MAEKHMLLPPLILAVDLRPRLSAALWSLHTLIATPLMPRSELPQLDEVSELLTCQPHLWLDFWPVLKEKVLPVESDTWKGKEKIGMPRNAS